MSLHFIAILVVYLVSHASIYSSDIEIKEIIQQEIQSKSQQIEEKNISNRDDMDLFDLYNERGICYFFKEEYISSLEDFNKILQRGYTHSDLDDALVGSALWGRTLCQAHLGLEKETRENIQLLREFFIEDKRWGCKKEAVLSRSELGEYGYGFQTVVQLANPNENISKYECEQRIIGSANALRALTSTIKRGEIVWTVNQFINEMEKVGLRCCRHGTIWATCMTPILEKAEKWKMYGIPPDPAWD